MKKVIGMVCVWILAITFMSLATAHAYNYYALTNGIDCLEVEVDVRSGLTGLLGMGRREAKIRKGSTSLVAIVIFSDPNQDFDASTVDPNTVTINGEAVAQLGSLNFDLNMDRNRDLILFYSAENLPLEVGETTLIICGEYTLDTDLGELIDCFTGTDTVTVTAPYSLPWDGGGEGFLGRLLQRSR